MIDVLHPSMTDQIAHRSDDRLEQENSPATESPADPEEADEDEEAAWLKSVQSASIDNVTGTQGLQSGNLVMDTQLRDEPAPSAAKRSLKARLPG